MSEQPSRWISTKVNQGRRLAYETFRATLAELLGQNGVTELRFRDEWLARLREQPQLTLSGWYEPPPQGIAVLFGHDDSEVPFSFASLRPSAYWPSERTMNWSRGLMYAYCSPIHLADGLPGDFGITLYFGRDPLVRSHFAAALSITHDIMQEITPRTMARPLFRHSEAMFREAGLRNNVASVTNSLSVDLGHSLPVVRSADLGSGRKLSAAAKSSIEKGRLFISESSDWALCRSEQFTIEPSLVSVKYPTLPQVSPHYVVEVSEHNVTIQDECDTLLAELDLLV
jgi:hypothetical protein